MLSVYIVIKFSEAFNFRPTVSLPVVDYCSREAFGNESIMTNIVFMGND